MDLEDIKKIVSEQFKTMTLTEIRRYARNQNNIHNTFTHEKKPLTLKPNACDMVKCTFCDTMHYQGRFKNHSRTQKHIRNAEIYNSQINNSQINS